MVGRKDGTHVKAHQPLMHEDKDARLPGLENGRQKGAVQGEVGEHAGRFGERIAGPAGEDELNARESYAKTLEQEHWEEVEGLKAGDAAHDAGFGPGLLFRERERRNSGMRVEGEVVREAVVVVVALDPPAAADAEQQSDERSGHGVGE